MSATYSHAAAPAGLHLSSNFSAEQRSAAVAIWAPIIERLSPILCDLKRLECADTPNGLIAQSPSGWVLMMCCLEGQRCPHYIAIRHTDAEHIGAIKAYLEDGRYTIKQHDEPDPLLVQVMRACVRRLGSTTDERSVIARRLKAPGSDHRRTSKTADQSQVITDTYVRQLG